MSLSVEAPTAAGESASTRGRPLYLQCSSGVPVLATLHPPAERASGIAVLLCPPFGWDELSTHRSVRAWAAELAHAGHTVLRLDLPGTGDSGGSPHDPGLVKSWEATILQAASWLRVTQGCERVVAAGIGLGGMLAVRALARGAPIDDLILWAVPSRGSLLLRELRAFAAMIAMEIGQANDPISSPDDDGVLQVGGFVVAAETVRALEAMNLTTEQLPHLERRRILLLGRDSLAPDRALRSHLERTGAEVTCSAGVGYGTMMRPPQFARRPEATIRRTVSWVGLGASDRPAAVAIADAESAPVPVAHRRAHLPADAVVERPFDVEVGGRRLAGVLAEPHEASGPSGPLTVVLLNAGAIRRIGPNRMWVEAARRWAAQGIPTLRIDLIHLGDADGDERHYRSNKAFYRPEVRDEVAAALDALQAAGLPDRFFVAGLCSGANQAFHAGFADPRVHGVALINLWAFFWTDELAASRDRRKARNLMSSRSWAEIVRIAVGRGKIGRIAGIRAAIACARPDFGHLYVDRVGDALGGLDARQVETLLLFSEEEPLYDDYFAKGWSKRLSRWPTVRLERIPISDHMFRPVWAQRHVHERLDAAVQRALVRVGSTITPPS